MLERIMVPLDGSEAAEAALPHARALAGVFDAALHLVRVLEPSSETSEVASSSFAWRLDRAEAKSYLDRVREGLAAETSEVRSHVLEGRAAEAITRFGRAHAIDLVILTSSGQGAGAGQIMGGTTQKLVRDLGVSTLLVPAGSHTAVGEGRRAYRRILVPLDGSPRAEWALSLAAFIARDQNAELLMAHVVQVPELLGRLDVGGEAGRAAEQLVELARRMAEEYLEQVRDRLPAELRLRSSVSASSQVAFAIQELARREHADLVVLSAHGGSPRQPWHYGRVAETLLQHPCLPTLVFQDLPLPQEGREPGSRQEMADLRGRG